MAKAFSFTEKCQRCLHPFGMHFTVYEENKMGCSVVDSYGGHIPYDDPVTYHPCQCQGFSMVVRIGPDGHPVQQ